MIKKSFNLEDSVLLLKQLRTEMHDKMDSGQLQNLDSVIEQLEKAKSQSQKLELLGKALNALPFISKIIDSIMKIREIL
ncbi:MULTISPECIES: hypothetical protein [Pasteurella]|uniref:hypothetical protein n=1 Tax=Pasteurella TaxID=745 RepID=UPI000744490A|nr:MULTISPECIES: hypothetical protein [Pasteurella]AMM82948.1 hypothetical protein AW43_06245 [Pasteurella multocida subsp. multocida PMTB2.1]APW56739.1 hypothetical protein BV212_00240 [Pasteurella multocida]AXQ71748.1 hypothetical protein AWY89_01760 [Pasteurella multocida subsp. multocida]KUM15818.1 hypothetical protein ASV60_01845 [Pasteurella multocida]KWW09742.1 hypothetical protein VM82_01925 [Pasteurella multocida]